MSQGHSADTAQLTGPPAASAEKKDACRLSRRLRATDAPSEIMTALRASFIETLKDPELSPNESRVKRGAHKMRGSKTVPI